MSPIWILLELRKDAKIGGGADDKSNKLTLPVSKNCIYLLPDRQNIRSLAPTLDNLQRHQRQIVQVSFRPTSFGLKQDLNPKYSDAGAVLNSR